jgi:CBS domain-containing protein
MTEKIARRGIKTPEEYMADALDHVHVRDIASKHVVTISAEDRVQAVREWIESGAPGTTHQGFPVVNEKGILVGVLTRRNVLNPANKSDQKISDLLSRPPKFVYDDCTVRQAADHMVNHGVGRLPVVKRDALGIPVGMITRSDILSVFQKRVREAQRQAPTIQVRFPGVKRREVVKK